MYPDRGAQILGARSSHRQRHLIFVSPHYQTCFMSPSWCLGFWGDVRTFRNFCNPALRQYSVISTSVCIITNSGADSSRPTVPPLKKPFYSANKCFSTLSDASISVVSCHGNAICVIKYCPIFKQFMYKILHLIVAVGLVWSSNLKSYATGNMATGRVSQARQVKGEVPGKVRYLVCASWGLGSGLTSQSHKTQVCWENNTMKFTIWQTLRITAQVRLSGMEEAKIHNVLQCLWRRRRQWITSSRGNFVTYVCWGLLFCAYCMCS